jgi:hypothetical protein
MEECAMSHQKIGNLFYDLRLGRYDIRFGREEYYGGLHCGECFDVLIDGKWIPTRIEMTEKREWYLVELQTQLNGLIVRM